MPADELTPFVEELAHRIASIPAHAIAHATAAVPPVPKPPVFIQPGDVCEVEIDGIGVLSNPVQGE